MTRAVLWALLALAPAGGVAALFALAPRDCTDLDMTPSARGAEEPVTLSIRSEAFGEGHSIPRAYSAYGGDVSPPLVWSGVPRGTKSLALLVEDPDARGPMPFVHWIVYGMVPTTTGLPAGLPREGILASPPGAMQGVNSRGTLGYFGPRPPAGDSPHHYHFELFALDNLPAIEPGAERHTLLGAMVGHVLAETELIGTFREPR